MNITHHPNGRITVDVPCVLEIEVNEGVQYGPATETLSCEAGRQSFTEQDVLQRVQDVVRDATKHDDTIMWRVTGVVEQ